MTIRTEPQPMVRGRRTRNRGAIAVAVVAIVVLLASSCSSPTDDAANAVAPGSIPNELEAVETPVPGGQLVVAITADTAGWNPVLNQWSEAGAMVGSSVIEPLVTMGAQGDAEPYLAESVTAVDPAFTQWDITVKPDIVFHDGEPLDAEAVKKNLDAAFQTGLTKVALGPMVDRVEVTGPLSVRVHLKKTWAQYPQILTSTGWMLSPKMIDHVDESGTPDGGSKEPVGTGPFEFVEWTPGTSFKAKRFDDYWQTDDAGVRLPYLDAIEFRPMPDDDSRERSLDSGDADMMATQSAQSVERMQDRYTVIRDYNTDRTYIALNTAESDLNAPNPFTNIHARKAVAYATDRQQIAAVVGTGVASTVGPFRPDSRWYLDEADSGYSSYDLEKAKEEIEAYKRDTGADALTFTLKGLPSVEVASLMQVLQQQWSAAGMDVKLDQVDQASYTTNVVAGNFQAAWLRGYNYADPDGNYIFHAAESIGGIGALNINFTQFTSARLQDNLLAGRASTDFDARKAASDEVTREINEQAITIWLYDTPYALIANHRVKGLDGFRTHPFANPAAKPYWGEAWIDQAP